MKRKTNPPPPTLKLDRKEVYNGRKYVYSIFSIVKKKQLTPSVGKQLKPRKQKITNERL